MPTAKRIQFSTLIHAPVATVWKTMLEPGSYTSWTSAFAEGSTYEGSWEQGQRIKFVSPSGEGMLSEIVESRLHEHISIRHLGMIGPGGVEDTTSEAVRAWAPAHENYTFTAVPEGTKLAIEMDVAADWEQYMLDSWPKALDRLKELSEAAVSPR
jgi:hypothetical protein